MRAICAILVSNMLASIPIANKAKPNSPPTANNNPVLKAVCKSIPDARTITATNKNLIANNSNAPKTASNQISGIMLGLTNIPMLIKNSPSNTSRKGRILDSI